MALHLLRDLLVPKADLELPSQGSHNTEGQVWKQWTGQSPFFQSWSSHSWWKEGPSSGCLSSQALGPAFDTPICRPVPLKGNRTAFCTTSSYFRGALV